MNDLQANRERSEMNLICDICDARRRDARGLRFFEHDGYWIMCGFCAVKTTQHIREITRDDNKGELFWAQLTELHFAQIR